MGFKKQALTPDRGGGDTQYVGAKRTQDGSSVTRMENNR